MSNSYSQANYCYRLLLLLKISPLRGLTVDSLQQTDRANFKVT